MKKYSKVIMIILAIVIVIALLVGGFLLVNNKKNASVKKTTTTTKGTTSTTMTTEAIKEIEKKDIVISAVGDCTLGTDTNFGYPRSFTSVLDKNKRDFSYFFSGVYDVLGKDDLTIANLEGTFTDNTVKVKKKFNFKGDFDYVNILTKGSIEVVNLANNHTYDYGKKGYDDTLKTLDDAKVPYFGYDTYKIMDVKGVKIGLAGLTGWSVASTQSNTKKAIDYFKKNKTDLIIITYHWGIERAYKKNNDQAQMGRYAIDQGADLVIAHHPHVVQEIEKYNGKYIVYSLGNFVFGGNQNPSDKDTMIFQQTFHYEEGKLKDTSMKIIPCSLSGKTTVNDYRPIILEGDERKRVLKKILDLSPTLNYKDTGN